MVTIHIKSCLITAIMVVVVLFVVKSVFPSVLVVVTKLEVGKA